MKLSFKNYPHAPYLSFLFLLGILAFGLTLGVGFMWDDHEMIENNPKITAINGSNLRHAFTSDVFEGKGDAYYRPIQILSYMIDYRLWGLNPFGFHLTNLLLHIGNAFLLFFLFLKFFKKKRIPFMIAGLFVVHPVVVEQLLIVAGRAEVMSFTFILAGLIVALRGNRHGYILSLVFYLLACFSKESGILFPVFLFLLGGLEPKLKYHWKKYIPYGLVAGFYLLVRHGVLPSGGLIPGFKETLLFSLGDLPSVWNEYIRIVLFPVDLHSHRLGIFRQVKGVLVFFGLVYRRFSSQVSRFGFKCLDVGPLGLSVGCRGCLYHRIWFI